jgi:hypothetical protein
MIQCVLHGGPPFILVVSFSSFGRLFLALRTSWNGHSRCCSLLNSLSLLSGRALRSQLPSSPFVRYRVFLPTHLLTNIALYCIIADAQTIIYINAQDDESCSHFPPRCQGM